MGYVLLMQTCPQATDASSVITIMDVTSKSILKLRNVEP